MVAKKSLIIFSIVILLISMSFVFAEITGEVTAVTQSKSVPTSVSEQESNNVVASDTTIKTREETPFIRRSLLRFSQGSSLAGWAKVARLGGGECYIPPTRNGLFGRV